MGHAADLLLRAEQSLSREFDILRAGVIKVHNGLVMKVRGAAA